MTDRTHVDEFQAVLADGFSKKLVATFIECHRDPSMKAVDVVTRLKEQMELALVGDADAAAQPDRP